MIRGKYLYVNDDLSEVFNIRKKVFQEEQGVDVSLERDGWDQMAIHALLFNENGKPVAAGRVIYTGEYYKIGRIAVLKEERGNKYGDFIVRMLVDKAFLKGADEVIVSSQLPVIDFYKKIGFVEYGEEFFESGIKHQGMKLVRGSLCKGCLNNCD